MKLTDVTETFESTDFKEVNEKLKIGFKIFRIHSIKMQIDEEIYNTGTKYVLGKKEG